MSINLLNARVIGVSGMPVELSNLFAHGTGHLTLLLFGLVTVLPLSNLSAILGLPWARDLSKGFGRVSGLTFVHEEVSCGTNNSKHDGGERVKLRVALSQTIECSGNALVVNG